MQILAVIPARGGSKSIRRKNLAPVEGRPLLAYVIDAARASRRLDRFVVSTEDEEIAAVARELGADVPFVRPHELATDEVSIVPVVRHAMEEMDRLGFRADAVLSLQATSPFLEGEDIDRVVEKFVTTGADCVCSVEPIEHGHPYWVKRLEGDRILPFNDASNDSYLQRQDLPPAYILDGGMFLRKRELLESWTGKDFGLGADARGVVLGGLKSLHIDDPLELEMVRFFMREKVGER